MDLDPRLIVALVLVLGGLAGMAFAIAILAKWEIEDHESGVGELDEEVEG